MLDPVIALGALALAMLWFPLAPTLDPGPSPECPNDMRLVAGTHYDEMQHYCVDPRRDAKDTHCYEYWEDVSAEEGTATEIRVCMDQFEAPNVRGTKPFVMKSYVMGKKWCAERKKRLCTEQEWELACEGRDRRPLAYGWKVDVTLCNSSKSWRAFDVQKLTGDDAQKEVDRLWQGTPSGQLRTCTSPFGVFDLMGNVEEWVTSRKERRFPGVLRGGFWAKPWTGCRGANDAHEPTFTFYETGFRCCSDPGQGASAAPKPGSGK